MSQALPLTTKIDQSSTCKVTYKTLTSKYGDGYQQTRPNGINDQVYTVTINYKNLSSADKTTVMNFIKAVKGFDIVTWTNTIVGDTTSSQYKIDMTQPITVTITSGITYNVTFTMTSYYGF